MQRKTLLISLFFLLVLCLGLLVLSTGAYTENRNVVLVLDVSGSMNEGKKFQAVQTYIEKDLFPNLLQPNDQFILILFGNSPRQAFSERIVDENGKKQILERIRKLKANDDYTDIGMALEYLFDLLSKMKGEGEVKVLFITDGKNTPPKTSPYYGKDLSVDARFREIGKRISQEGWFIYVIGIGKETDAKHIASAVEGSVLRETDPTLQDVRVEEYIKKTDEVRKARDAERTQLMQEGPASSYTGISAVIHRWAMALGVPPLWLYGVFILMVLGILAGIVYIVWRKVRPVKVLVWDSQLDKSKAIRLSLAIGSSVTFNTDLYRLPALGREEHPAMQLGRNLKGLWIRILDDTIVQDTSPYRDKGTHPLRKGTLELSNGEKVFIV